MVESSNLVLNQIRSRIEPIMNSIGRILANHKVTPDLLTSLGFGLGLIAGILFAIKPGAPYIGALLVFASGIFDLLDGAVARAMNRVSALGSLHDSTLDRVSETAIYAGIIYGGYGINPIFVLVTAAVSLLVSYVRAKGESLSIKMSGVGVGERAERLIVLIVFSFIGLVAIGVYVILVLALITFIQRYLYVARKLPPDNFSNQS